MRDLVEEEVTCPGWEGEIILERTPLVHTQEEHVDEKRHSDQRQRDRDKFHYKHEERVTTYADEAVQLDGSVLLIVEIIIIILV